MEGLAQATKERLFRLGVKYGVLANSLNASFHSLVGAVMRRPVWWTQNDSFDVTEGMVGAAVVGGKLGVQVTTAQCKRGPAIVSFVYALEMAQVILRQWQEGTLLCGFYTTQKAEANALAYAFLYVTAQVGTPCGGTMPYGAIYDSMKKVYANDRGFFWSVNSRIADNTMIKRMWQKEL
jgi:hypothetical protein